MFDGLDPFDPRPDPETPARLMVLVVLAIAAWCGPLAGIVAIAWWAW